MENSDTKLVLLSAGGTGGHMFPAVALARDLISRGYRVALATDRRGRHYTETADMQDVAIHVLNAGTLGPGVVQKLKSVLALIAGYMQAAKLIDRLRPALVVGFGGYPSLPPVLAAQRRKIPTILHEQNAVLGRANAFLAPRADRIALSSAHVEGLDESDAVRAVVAGNPVRADIAALYNTPYPTLTPEGPFHIFVTGGSQGAQIFSDVVPPALARLPDLLRARLHVTQQCRVEDMPAVREVYEKAGIKVRLESFFTDIAAHLAAAHLVIARSGAGTVAEVTTAGRPAIFVPYPHHADQQQKRNADMVANAGGAWVITQDGFTPEALTDRVAGFAENPEILFRAAESARSCGRPDAARKLGNLVTALASGWDKAALKSYDLTQGRAE